MSMASPSCLRSYLLLNYLNLRSRVVLLRGSAYLLFLERLSSR